MKILLDTNAYSAIGRGHPEATDLMRRSEALILSTVVLGEILAGFRHGSRWDVNMGELRRFLTDPPVSDAHVTEITAERYSLIYTTISREGTPIPTNDMWIAAHALETGAHLVSFDSHFGHVAGLSWIDPGVAPPL